MIIDKVVCFCLSLFLFSTSNIEKYSNNPLIREVDACYSNLEIECVNSVKHKKDDNPNIGNYTYCASLSSDAIAIPNAFYFQKLGGRHGYNPDAICTIIAAQIIFGYYDTFVNDYLVDDMYDFVSVDETGAQSIQSFEKSPGTGSLEEGESDQRFTDYLVDLGTNEIGISAHVDGYTTYQQSRVVRRYLNERDFDFTLNTVTNSSFGQNLTKSKIKYAINNGRPVICNDRDHSVVAYAYDDDYVYVHTGWGWPGRVIWETFEDNSNVGYEIGAIDIVLSCEHIHSDNYYSSYYHKAYCPDGFERGRMELKPNDFGFEPQYYFYQKLKNIYVGDDTIQTRRLRTGYIENSFINLSPRRQDAGIAYLEMTFPDVIRNIVVDISFWGGNELYDPNIHNARIEYKDSDNHWVEAIDLLHDISLSTNRFNQDRINIVFPEETLSFRFYASNYAVGNLNKGRISIGGISITYE